MKKQRGDDEREKTRSTLARAILALLAIVVIGLLFLVGLERKLSLSPEAFLTLQNVLKVVSALAAMVALFYFTRRR